MSVSKASVAQRSNSEFVRQVVSNIIKVSTITSSRNEDSLFHESSGSGQDVYVFSVSNLPPLDQMLIIGTLLESICSVDIRQGSAYPLK